MKPIRIEREEQVAQAPWSAGEHVAGQTDTEHALDNQGAIASHKSARRFAAVCGCLADPGGFCSVCGEAVCVKCFHHCAGCSKPLCPRHSRAVADKNGTETRFCEECYGAVQRRSAVRGVLRTLLSPFVEFTDER